MDYRSRLKDMNLFSIYGRMMRSDMVKIWKAFNSDTDVGLANLLEQISHSSTRGHGFKLSVPRCRSEIRRRFWNVRCVRQWNSLPVDVVGAGSVEAFEIRLDGYLEDILFDTIDGN